MLNKSRSAEAYLTPVLILLQGIPALSWVVIAVIWFHGTEFRIFFIMLVTTLPAFTFQILDAVRSMSKDLFEMTVAFRPTRWTLFRVLVLPTVVPGILTAWKVNLGNASRVVVVAELVGATGGVGYELLAPAAAVRHGRRHRLDAAARRLRAGVPGPHHGHRGLGAALAAEVGAGDLMAAAPNPVAVTFQDVTKTFERPDRSGSVHGRRPAVV